MAIKMTDYDKEHRKAVKRLDNYVKKEYTIEEQEVMEFYSDKITDTHYIWRFKLYGDSIELQAGLNDTSINVIED